MSLEPAEIGVRLRAGELTVGVIGLGWMGLPTACLFADAGTKVVGADQDSRTVERVNKGELTIDEPGLLPILKKAVRSGKLRGTTSNEEAASQSDAIIIIVPTSIDKQKRADYSALEDAAKGVGKGLRAGSLVILESTVAPGVTERLLKGVLEKHSGLKAGENFGLAYSPIRGMGGRAVQDLQSYAKAVGGMEKKSLEATCAVLSVIVRGELLRMRDIKTAEAAKIFEVIYRDTNIALANELAILCEVNGIDYMEAMRAANTQPYSHLHLPGVGVGGHCVPVYPYLLMTEADALSAKPRLVSESRRINEKMPRHVLHLVADALRVCGRSLKRARVTVLGITYRPGVRELRFSPSLDLINLLRARGARVTVYDPLYSPSEISKMGYSTEPTLKKSLEKADCAVIAVAHEDFKGLDVIELAAPMSKPGSIVDCAHILDPVRVEKSGMVYRGVGRGIWTR